jgi:hypothetical protein
VPMGPRQGGERLPVAVRRLAEELPIHSSPIDLGVESVRDYRAGRRARRSISVLR